MEKTFIQGRQIWGQPGQEETKKALIREACRRAEMLWRVAVTARQGKALCGGGK